VDELASLTKIPRRSLERLEAGAFDAAPDGFVRGFVRTVAEALGLDPGEAVMRLMSEPPDDEAAAARARGLGQRTMFARAALVAAAALLVVVLWRVALSWLSPAAEPGRPEVVMRRDAVRALARDTEPPAATPDALPAQPSEAGGVLP
jgi:cytoskeletal protein RodZ